MTSVLVKTTRMCARYRPGYLPSVGLMYSQQREVKDQVEVFPIEYKSNYFRFGLGPFQTSHFTCPNLIQMSENNRCFSFALDSAHVKCGV